LPVVINVKNFIDGMQEHIEIYGVEIPPERLATDAYSLDYLLE
jgi:ferredoxin-thioredoxin reductase catalytic subunit